MRDSNELQSILSWIADPLIHVNRELECLYINPAAERLFGVDSDQLDRKPLSEILPRSTFAALAEPVHRAMKSGESLGSVAFDPVAEKWFESRLYPSAEGLTLLIREQSGAGSQTSETPDNEPLAAALRTSQAEFYALADATPQIVWTILPSGAVTYLNQPGREYFGIGHEEKPFGWGPLIHPEDLPRLNENWSAALESGQMFDCELRLRRHDGVYRWHLGRALPVRDASGEITHWCGTSTDIHDLKISHDLVSQREELFRTMADAVPVQIWMADPSKKRTYFNRGWLDYTGRSIEEEFGDGWIAGLYPEDRDRYLEIYHSSFDHRVSFRMEYRLLNRDSSYRWIIDTGVPLYDASGNFTGYIGSCIDIHERKQLEEQVRFLAEASPVLTSSLNYESTLQTVADLMVPELADWCGIEMLEDGELRQVAVAHVDPEKVQFAHELRRNYPPKMDAASGMPNVVRTGKSELYPEIPEEMLVRAAQDEEHLRIIRQIGFKSALIVPLEARGQLLGGMTLVWSESERRYSESDLRFMEELARRAAIVVDNARLYRRAQDAREELTVLNETLEQRVVERTDELTAANMTLRDEIEERKRAQQTLARANALLEYRNRELQDFAYVASHDLQEPLRKILSFSSLLLDEFTDSLGDGRSYLERIDDAANRMMGLIRDLLAFSRVATQGDPFRKIDLNTVVDVALTDLEVRIAETAGRVEVAQLCTVEADELQMRQLFQNLIGNALKFHREGVPPVISVDCRLNGDYCVIEVRDNGIGFDEKYVDRIFAPFQRLHGRGSYAGTGIGLAICRRIVERHDGSISARSRPDEGSTFVVTLPLRHRTESEMDSEASAA